MEFAPVRSAILVDNEDGTDVVRDVLRQSALEAKAFDLWRDGELLCTLRRVGEEAGEEEEEDDDDSDAMLLFRGTFGEEATSVVSFAANRSLRTRTTP